MFILSNINCFHKFHGNGSYFRLEVKGQRSSVIHQARVSSSRQWPSSKCYTFYFLLTRRPVLSVYPTNLHEEMHLDFNRSFMCIDNRYNDRNSVKIMWMPMQVSENSYPVHFVPLLKAVSLLSKIYVNYILINVNTCFN